ncbi:DNA polymerase I [Coraliomargarita akajimensis]|uniref:DNA polymerase I n=1 Tax=Coraliomargarita akajimensis (strain DSM 45221 / IAM 15411 / JCM 23193 / KCTC 12865 / 04OKA010-24) TaxID=583355 RepID=D5ELW9_CORAD|nr:DNA polymerase I [Coraliomargarita akajimensis]ADE53294.1 DNA polymerase I [Coraliomargarita akajimensis DSM 45221]
MKSLFLLDGMALAYRAHFALIRSPIYTSKGFNTSAIFGFTGTLIELIKSGNPSHLAIVFDTSAPTERHRIHPEYKANREEMPEDLRSAMPHLDRIAEAFDIPVLKLDGYEADDIIGTLAHRAEAEGFDEIYMVTPDKDFGQLVTERIKMYRPGRKGDGAEILGVDEVKAKWGIARVDQVIDMLGLCGDSVDNIPGVPGIGPKTAEKLLAKYDTVEGLLDHVDELKGKQQEKVRDNADQARMSKLLATIQKDVPIAVEWSALELHAPEQSKIVPLFTEFEFRTLGKRIFGNDFSVQEAATDLVLMSEDDEQAAAASSETPAGGQLDLIPAITFKKLADVTHTYAIADTTEQLQRLCTELREAGSFAFDSETTALNPRQAELVGLSFATKAHSGWWVPASSEALDALRPLFADNSITKIGHNLKFDLAILAAQSCPVDGPCYDTMLAHALIEPEQRHNLDTLAEDYLRYSTIRFSELMPDAKKGSPLDYSSVDPQALADYATEDADVTLQLWECFKPKLEESGQASIFYEIETPLLPVLVAMESEGIRLCTETLEETGRVLEGQIATLKDAVYAAAGREFNLNSPKQLGEVLFNELKLVDKPKKTKTGQFATNEQVLSSLAPKHPIVADLLEYRQLSKLKSTYIDALPNAVDPVSGRVHTHYGQVQTATGRLSSNDPNLQNIPVRSAQGREIRKAFVPREGWTLLAADYSQIELRILAALTADEGLLTAFREGRDIHTATAAKIFEVDADTVSRDQRSTAKMVNFGIPYGISAFGLAQRLGTVSRTEAQNIIDNYFAQFPGIPGYMQAQQESARAKGYVATVCGRRRYLRDINSGNGTIRAAAERNAINMPIQGTAADMIKLAMIRVHHAIIDAGLKSRMLLQVHDELIFDLAPGEESALRQLVTGGMQDALQLACPIEIEIGTGMNWLEAH